MEKNRVDFFLAANSSKFESSALMSVRDALEKLNDDQFLAIQSIEYRDPSVIFIIAFFLGWERFWLDDIALGVVKIITCYGFGIWWLIDLFTAFSRAKKYNFKRFIETVALMR